MGFDVDTFGLILQGFQAEWELTPIERSDVNPNGEPRLGAHSLNAAGGLGLVLHYIHSCMTETSLQQIFGLVPATVDCYIQFGLRILDSTLASIPEACIVWPNGTKMAEYNSMIVQWHPLLQGAFGSIDGLKLPVQVPEDPMMENATYNSWTHGHYSNQIFVFGPDGECSIDVWLDILIFWEGVILDAILNAPGIWNDSHLALPVYEQLLHNTPEGSYLVSDMAFPWGTSHVSGKIKAPLKQGNHLSSNLLLRSEQLAFDQQLLSYRQTAKWGMHALRGAFGWLRVPLDVVGACHFLLLRVVVQAHNLRTTRVGINQICSVYCNIWSEGDGEEIWQGFVSIMFGDLRKHDRVARLTMAVEQDEE